MLLGLTEEQDLNIIVSVYNKMLMFTKGASNNSSVRYKNYLKIVISVVVEI